MPKRSSKDINQTAFSVVQQATQQADKGEITILAGDADKAKNPAAVALGRLGGLKGGKARAKSLTKAERKRIARRAALKRWAVKSKP